jgi:hypothetical protein
MANNKNNFTSSITNKRTIPFNITKQGTINTVGKGVQGSNGLTYNTLVGTIGIGNVVTGSTSGAYGTVYADSGTVVNLNNINGVFVDTEVLTFRNTAGTSVATAAVNGVPTYTLFTKQCMVGDFIYNATQSEVHKIVYISDDISMQIQEAFGSDLVAQALIVSPCVPRPKEISVLIPNGNPAGVVDGVTWPAGIAWTDSKTSQYNNGRDDGQIDPIVVDATGTTMIVNINY